MPTHKDNGGLPNYSEQIAPRFKEYVTTSHRLSARRPDMVKARKMGHGKKK